MFKGRNGALFVGLLLLVAGAFLVALASGSADVSIAQMFAALRGDAPQEIQSLVTELRLPRALTAFAVGGLLAVAGVLMQVLLRNPLAEPYILGSSGGAAVAALLAMMFGMGSAIVDLIPRLEGDEGADIITRGAAVHSSGLNFIPSVKNAKQIILCL